MMFDLEYECLYDLMTAMFGLLPCFKMYDRVSHARVSHMRLGLAFFCLKVDMYVFRDE